jgi:hypothetical protein
MLYRVYHKLIIIILIIGAIELLDLNLLSAGSIDYSSKVPDYDLLKQENVFPPSIIIFLAGH